MRIYMKVENYQNYVFYLVQTFFLLCHKVRILLLFSLVLNIGNNVI